MILFEFEADEIAEPKALSCTDLKHLIKIHGSMVKTAYKIGTSEAFVRQNAKKRPDIKKVISQQPFEADQPQIYLSFCSLLRVIYE